jgi:DmsE family decaheme c-type cytochrome
VNWHHPPIWLALLGLLGFALPAKAQGPGAEVCQACHAPYFESYRAHPHGTKADQRTPANAGECAACHGDGTAHVQAGGGKGVGGVLNLGPKSPLRPEERSKVCLTCHQGGTRMHWQGDRHAAADVACTNCHTVHSRDRVLARFTQADVCLSCHLQQRAELNRPSRHPIREGQITCSQCHNPHGSVGPKQLVRATINETCYTCHAEKRGPFLWEHPPAREDCTNCHTAHGSIHTPLLKARGPWLCQQCHLAPMHPSTVYSGRSVPPFGAAQQVLAHNCMNCHSQVHGSNHPSGPRLTR